MIRYTLVAVSIFLLFKLSQSQVTVKILHTNRFRSHFDASGKDKTVRGGMARIIEYVNSQKKMGGSVLYLDTMDWTTGSIWYSVHKTKIATAFMKILDVDALGLGCSEMFLGDVKARETRFWQYINSICDKTILCANCEITSTFEGSNCIKKSKVFELENAKVGVTAFIVRDRVPKKPYRKMKITDEIDAVNQEVELLTSQGIKIIVVIAHGDSINVMRVVKKFKNVDLVVGGHSRKLLYNGKPPRGDSDGPYPEKIKTEDGEEVLIVYCGEFGQYVGNIALNLDGDGKVTDFIGNPQYMDKTIDENGDALKLLETFKPAVEEFRQQVVGRSRVYINGTCWKEECSFGNLLTDAFIHHRAKQWVDSKQKYWTDAAIAFVNSGNIKESISAENQILYMSDLMSGLPYNNIIYSVTLSGATLKQVLEYSATLLDEEDAPGFLQVAGLHIIYDLTKPSSKRIVSVKARCAECDIPEYRTVNDNSIYKALTLQFLRDGGNGYTFGDAKFREVKGGLEIDMLKAYVEASKTIQIGKEERIIFAETEKLTKRSQSVSCTKESRPENSLLFVCMLYIASTY